MLNKGLFNSLHADRLTKCVKQFRLGIATRNAYIFRFPRDVKDADDSDYWHGRSPIERVEAIEFMRKVMFGNDRVSKRLQRVLTVVELKRS